MKIKPANGRAVRHPGTLRLLASQGEVVTPSPFWHRLIANGDVEILPEETPPLTSQPTESDNAL